MTFINPINVNAQGVGNSYGHNAKPKQEDKEANKAEVIVNNEQTPVSADKVLEFMAQSAVLGPKMIDPSKYVDKESEVRIAGFMADFEDKVAEGLAAFDVAFKGVDISDSAKIAVVLAGIDKEV